jgi:pyruvate dehydrogenase E2 component (dihydrolipoamide acetyltransferase)
VAEEIVMPRLSDTMERGTIARWLVHEGDAVHEGDVLAEIETDKATMELNSYSDGVLLRILVQDGEAAELGAPIAVVGAEGEDASSFSSSAAANGDAATGAGAQEAPAAASAPASEQPRQAAAPAATTGDSAAPAAASAPASEQSARQPAAPAATAGESTAPATTAELKASPVARRIASDAGFDLRALAGKGSGPDGRIVRVDVERALAGATPPAPAPAAAAAPARAAVPPPGAEAGAEAIIEPSPMLKAVARRMSASKSQVPHFYLQCEIDMGKALGLREELNAELAADGVKLTVNDLIVRACALALRDHPEFHRSWIDGEIHQHTAAHVGVAVALDEGLIVPVIRNADSLSLRDLAGVARDLVARARAGKLKQPEIEGGTFSVSNLGMLGITSFQAIINPPEPGILAVGSVVERATGVGGQVVVRPLMSVNLSVDHRAASGADGARLLQTVTRYLEHPLLLLV